MQKKKKITSYFYKVSMSAPGDYPDSFLTEEDSVPQKESATTYHRTIKALQQATNERFAFTDRRLDRLENKLELKFDLMMKEFAKLSTCLTDASKLQDSSINKNESFKPDHDVEVQEEHGHGNHPTISKGTPNSTTVPPQHNPSDQARLPDGRINLFRTVPPYHNNMTIQEKYVKDIWPEAKLKSEIFYSDSVSSNNRNRVVLKPEWKLSRASNDVFSKLRNIQTASYLAMIP